MNDYEEAKSVREEAQALAMRVGAGRAVLAATGERDKTLDEAAETLTRVITKAAAVEQRALTAATETLDPVEFAKARQARLAESGHGLGCRCAGLDQRCAVMVRREQIEKRRQAVTKRPS